MNNYTGNIDQEPIEWRLPDKKSDRICYITIDIRELKRREERLYNKRMIMQHKHKQKQKSKQLSRFV